MFFSFFPPEVLSALMYTGPGAGPLTQAAAAWEGLATDLYATAASYQSSVADLTSGWSGPSAMAMASAAGPFVSWMTATAAAAAESGVQASAGAAAFETAHALTVPPPVVAANRALFGALVSTNIFGQNSPAIAATEADYLEMWAQDVAMMSGYSAAVQTTVHSMHTGAFQIPPATTNASTTDAQPVSASQAAGTLAGLASLSAQVQSTLSALSTSAPIAWLLNTTGLTSLINGTGLTQSSIYSVEAGYYGAMIGSMPARMFMSMGNSAANSSGLAGSQGLLASVSQFLEGKLQAVVGGITGQLRSWESTVTAQLAHATNLSGLSVPQAWSTAAAQPITRAAPVLPQVTAASPTMSQAWSMPQSPFAQSLMGTLSAHGLNGLASKVPGKVVARSPAGG